LERACNTVHRRAALAPAIGLVSRRGQPIFFAIATSAVAYAFNYFASRLSLPVIGEGGELALRPRLEG
jgi:ABC-type branched-subunit amino acid transport system permease subunit